VATFHTSFLDINVDGGLKDLNISQVHFRNSCAIERACGHIYTMKAASSRRKRRLFFALPVRIHFACSAFTHHFLAIFMLSLPRALHSSASSRGFQASSMFFQRLLHCFESIMLVHPGPSLGQLGVLMAPSSGSGCDGSATCNVLCKIPSLDRPSWPRSLVMLDRLLGRRNPTPVSVIGLLIFLSLFVAYATRAASVLFFFLSRNSPSLPLRFWLQNSRAL